MKVWLIRGKFNYSAVKELYKKYPNMDKGFIDGQYLYWTRNSMWANENRASIQVNKPSATRAFKRALKRMEGEYKWVIDLELAEAEVVFHEQR